MKLEIFLCVLFVGFSNALFSLEEGDKKIKNSKSEDSQIQNPNKDWCPNVSCQNIGSCKPCDKKFLFVLAQGRSGSTTMKNMLNELPGVRLSGEVGDTIKEMKHLWDYILNNENLVRGRGNFKGSWGHNDYPPSYLSCPAQMLIESINPPQNFEDEESKSIIGFKEIRVDSIETMEFLLAFFPCSRFVFNIRSDPVGLLRSQNMNFGNDGYSDSTSDKLPELYRKFYDMLGPNRAYFMDMVQWSKMDGKKYFDELAKWLRFENCSYPGILHDNTGNGYELDDRRFDLGSSCRYSGKSLEEKVDLKNL